MRYGDATYVLKDLAVRAEILRVNYNDPWDGGHFSRARTLKVIKRYY